MTYLVPDPSRASQRASPAQGKFTSSPVQGSSLLGTTKERREASSIMPFADISSLWSYTSLGGASTWLSVSQPKYLLVREASLGRPVSLHISADQVTDALPLLFQVSCSSHQCGGAYLGAAALDHVPYISTFSVLALIYDAVAIRRESQGLWTRLFLTLPSHSVSRPSPLTSLSFLFPDSSFTQKFTTTTVHHEKDFQPCPVSEG